MGERRDAYRFQMGRPEEKSPIGSPRPRREVDIKIDIQEVGLGHGLD